MDERFHPLSFPQHTFWLLEQFTPEAPAYNLPRAFNIGGSLNVQLTASGSTASPRRLTDELYRSERRDFQRVDNNIDIDVTSLFSSNQRHQ
jgi:hypothetical protein